MNQEDRLPIRLRVDVTNPGQFFACCGLLELADRLWEGAEGWFEDLDSFCMKPLHTSVDSSLENLLKVAAGVNMRLVDPDNHYSSPIDIESPFSLRLDWWNDWRSGGIRLKVWAGSMKCHRIARAMQSAMMPHNLDALFDHETVVYDPIESDKKVEPFYFDARRGANALSLDIGFSPDSLQMMSKAHPAVELLCLVGLQRFRPKVTNNSREFEYSTWPFPLSALVAPLAVCGLMEQNSCCVFRFENAFRTDQEKHKAFTPATLLKRGNPLIRPPKTSLITVTDLSGDGV